MKILVVEDDRAQLKVLARVLGNLGHEILTARDGVEAWEMIEGRDIRMVITDWLMPRMDGPTLCRKIRETNSPQYIYTVLLTSMNRSEDVVSGIQAGADDYISKPFNHAELSARIAAGQRIIQLEDERNNVAAQLLQSEKMASIGQLAAGVAHEINNPIGFILSNFNSLRKYVNRLVEFTDLQSQVMESLNQPAVVEELSGKRKELRIDFVLEDIIDLIEESTDGASRVKKIVQDLKTFSRLDEMDHKYADINECLESTINIVRNELKYLATLTKQYGELPPLKCYPQQLNQVFMNLLINAAHAIEEQGEIVIKTWSVNNFVCVSISDTGSGIPAENLDRIFDPFFTTKEVGKGTGLGLSISYDLVNKHNGELEVESEFGKGTTFTVKLPLGKGQQDG